MGILADSQMKGEEMMQQVQAAPLDKQAVLDALAWSPGPTMNLITPVTSRPGTFSATWRCWNCTTG